MRLAHLHFPGLTRYSHVAAVQERLVRRLLDHKARYARTSSAAAAAAAAGGELALPPDPTVITAQFHSVYTCGRRERNTVSPEQEAHLRRGGRADFFEALRGGQTTYHGPGQLTAYVVCDLKRHGLASPRCYVDALEGAVIDLLRHGDDSYGAITDAARTENPGVWVDAGRRKICAVGVHLRRYVSSHGVGLNVTREPEEWLGRIVACGLADKSSASIEGWTGRRVAGGVEEVGRRFARSVGARLGVTGEGSIYEVQEEDLFPAASPSSSSSSTP